MNLEQPLVLDPCNFTSLAETPWAGNMLAPGIKSHVVSEANTRIGESWEFSCSPAHPSKLKDSPISLMELFDKYPAECGKDRCEILIKILNPAAPLSLQVHPSDNDPNLKANECGKPESWLVLDAKPNAGIYLGFANVASESEVRTKILQRTFGKKDLHFVPVKKGDYFEIEPGVVHIVGPDVVILEPQRVLAGKSGKTFRLWDWNRTYDSAGKEDPNGKSRELHLEQGIRLIDFGKQHGRDFSNSLRRSAQSYMTQKEALVRMYPDNGTYQVCSLESKNAAQAKITIKNGYGAFTLLSGEVEMVGKNGRKVQLDMGSTAFLPFACFPLAIQSRSAFEGALVLVEKSGVQIL